MSHFAHTTNGLVDDVIVADQTYINTLPNASEWVQTSYNTYGGVHNQGGTPLRKNFAGIGFTYDANRDAFIPPKQYPSWALDEFSCLWKSPVEKPNDGQSYYWNEPTVSWVKPS